MTVDRKSPFGTSEGPPPEALGKASSHEENHRGRMSAAVRAGRSSPHRLPPSSGPPRPTERWAWLLAPTRVANRALSPSSRPKTEPNLLRPRGVTMADELTALKESRQKLADAVTQTIKQMAAVIEAETDRTEALLPGGGAPSETVHAGPICGLRYHALRCLPRGRRCPCGRPIGGEPPSTCIGVCFSRFAPLGVS